MASVSFVTPLITSAAVITASTNLVPGNLNKVDATSGSLTETLPAPTAAGEHLVVMKVDSGTNTVIVSGSIRGNPAATITLRLPEETIELVSDTTTWWPTGDHKTLSSLDARFDAAGVATAAVATQHTTDNTLYAPIAEPNAATETTRALAAEALLAPKASPALTGTPTAPTAAALDNSTKIGTTAYADAATAVEKTRALAAEALLSPLLTVVAAAPTGVAATDTANLDSAVSATPVGGNLVLPSGTYVRNTAWVINKHIRIIGSGCFPLFQSRTAFAGSFDFPSQSPFLSGTVIQQNTAATDAIQLTGSATRADLFDFGITFASAIRHTNTGHGVNAMPTQTIGGRTITDGATTGTTAFSSPAQANFTSADLGSIIVAPGVQAGSTIITITSATAVVLSKVTTATASGLSSSITGFDHGIFNSTWRNVSVLGHDGNHYGFALVNGLLNRWEQLRTFGGGGFFVQTASNQGNYGNLYANDTYAQVTVGGSAHAYALQGNGGGSSGKLNLISFTRIQGIVENHNATTFPEIASNPTTAQKLYTNNPLGVGVYVSNLSIQQPDFESYGIGSVPDFTMLSGSIDTSGIYGGGAGTSFFTAIKPPATNTGQNAVQYMDGRWAGKNASAGTPTAGANAGTSPPAPVAGSDNSDERGFVTFGTGTTPAAGVLCRVPYSAGQGGNQRVMLTPINAATAALQIYATHDSTGINVCAGVAPAASQGNAVYGVEYFVKF